MAKGRKVAKKKAPVRRKKGGRKPSNKGKASKVRKLKRMAKRK